MSLFRKLFGGKDDKTDEPVAAAPPPAPPPAPSPAEIEGDPYRGPAFVVRDEELEEPVVVGVVPAIWHWEGRVLALERGKRLPLRAMVYFGKENGWTIRRVTFGEGGVRLDWEFATRFANADDGYIVRVDDRVVYPLGKGVIARHLVTGELCWELPHPSTLQQPPRIDREGNLLLMFEDQRWMVVSPRDGATVREGAVRNDREAEEVADRYTRIVDSVGSRVQYAGREVSTYADALVVNSEGRARDDEGVRPPAEGKYPLDDEWGGGSWIARAGGRLAVGLARSWSGRQSAAVALLDATSLEPIQLLELGEVEGNLTCWEIDGMFVIDTDVVIGEERDVMFVVDPIAERVIAFFCEDGMQSYLFDRSGARVWAAPL